MSGEFNAGSLANTPEASSSMEIAPSKFRSAVNSVGTAIHATPAAVADATPLGESSIAMHSFGDRFKALIAVR